MKETPAAYGDLSRRAALVFLGCLLLARLLLGVAYGIANPLGEAPDEADHYAYAAYIGREGRLPQGPEMTQSKHPPLYYILAAGLARAAGAEMDFAFLRSNPDVGVGLAAAAPNFFIHTRLEAWPWRDGVLSMYLGRMLSIIAGVFLTAATYLLARAIWPAWYTGPLAAAAFVAFLPESLFIGGAVSNDILAAMWSALAFWLGLRARGIGGAVLAGLAMGLAFLTKTSTAGLWPVVLLAMLFSRPSTAFSGSMVGEDANDRSFGNSFSRAVVAGAVASLLAVPWLWRNFGLYGDPLGWPLVLATIDLRPAPLSVGDLAVLARGWFFSFWGKTGGAGQLSLPAPFYVAWALLILAAVTGGLVGWRRRDKGQARRVQPAGWIVLIGAPLMTVVSILSYSRVALGTDQGRLLFPALAPLAILLVLGISGWLRPKNYRWLPIGFSGGMGVVALLVLAVGIMLPFAPPPPPPSREVMQAAPTDELFGDRLELLAYRWGDVTPDGAAIPLKLYWSAAQSIGQDLRTTLSLTDASGSLVWEWKRSPGAGRFSTDHWKPDRVVDDTYLVPVDALNRATAVGVGVRPFPEGEWLSPETRTDGSPMFPIVKPSL